jgi:putative Mn2+ efflux pump MntP
MLPLKTKVTDVLDEARILVLGTQVLLGFQFQARFRPGFVKLPAESQWASLVSLLLIYLALMLLIAPAAYHRIAEEGDDSSDLKHIAGRAIGVALPLLAGSLGLDIALISVRTIENAAAITLGALVVLLALGFWVGMGIAHRREEGPSMNTREKSSLEEKIQTLLTESRVILPGVQALLGFQLAAMLTDKFETLPEHLRQLHLGGLLLIAIAIILLIAPAAYHRLAADGEPREDVDSFGAKVVLGALVPLALGLSADLYIVVAMQAGSGGWALSLALAALAGFLLLWGVFPVAARRWRRHT